MDDLGRAGSNGPGGLARLRALPLLRVRLVPCAPARTRVAGTLGAVFPEGVTCSEPVILEKLNTQCFGKARLDFSSLCAFRAKARPFASMSKQTS